MRSARGSFLDTVRVTCNRGSDDASTSECLTWFVGHDRDSTSVAERSEASPLGRNAATLTGTAITPILVLGEAAQVAVRHRHRAAQPCIWSGAAVRDSGPGPA